MNTDMIKNNHTDEMTGYNEISCPLSEILTVQSIICVVVSIIFVLINIFYPQIAVEIYDITSESFNYEVQLSELSEDVKAFFSSTLSDRLYNDKI